MARLSGFVQKFLVTLCLSTAMSQPPHLLSRAQHLFFLHQSLPRFQRYWTVLQTVLILINILCGPQCSRPEGQMSLGGADKAFFLPGSKETLKPSLASPTHSHPPSPHLPSHLLLAWGWEKTCSFGSGKTDYIWCLGDGFSRGFCTVQNPRGQQQAVLVLLGQGWKQVPMNTQKVLGWKQILRILP